MKADASSSSTCVLSSDRRQALKLGLAATLAPLGLTACAPLATVPPQNQRELATTTEVRGTWLTTTANTAIATPANAATTMRRLREIGLNTVYAEVWKNGYTQYPSAVLERTIGVPQRPTQSLQDPSDKATSNVPRDLLQETLIEAHRNGLHCYAWFEYGFMAAHASTQNHLRRLKPEWLSRDAQGSEVAPNGFVWMNPLHPQARRFLLDLVLESVARYDLDGVQFDDRIVWPHVTMGYDDTTRAVYAAEHQGQQPPLNAHDPAWMRWRADKLNALVQDFMRELRTELRQSRPALRVSLSPAVYPWSYENYLLEWPQWARWPASMRFDEFVPQAYRTSYAAFESTWREQTQALQTANAYEPKALIAGIRINGAGDESTWAQLRDSMALVRQLGQGGHVLWFSRGVLDLYAAELTAWYAQTGPARSPFFAPHWRRTAAALRRDDLDGARWHLPNSAGALPAGRYRAIVFDGRDWRYLTQPVVVVDGGPTTVTINPSAIASTQRVELLVDRRGTPS
jgi:uncharacterized lipoprotein YddW (UPF0748 family)